MLADVSWGWAGSLPSGWGSMASLQKLALGQNNMTGMRSIG